MSEYGRRFLPIRRDQRAARLWSSAAVALACSVSALTVGRLWFFSDPYPPGLDGAQWLSYGRSLFGGAGRGAESTYAPLVPLVAHGLSICVGPVLGLRFLAISILVLLAAAVWLLSARLLGVTWGSLTTAMVLPSTAMAEPFFYGGYPQQISLAFGILGITALLNAGRARRLNDQRRALLLATTAFILASASHLMFGPLLLVSGVLVVLTVGPSHRDQRRFQLRATASLIPATALSLFIALDFRDHGYSAPLAASQRTFPEAWSYATRESPTLWAAIVIGGIAAAAVVVVKNLRQLPARRLGNGLPDAVAAGIALAGPSATLMLASGQPRLAPPLLLGGAILAAYAMLVAAHAWPRAFPVAWASWYVAALCLAWVTTGVTRDFANYYQVLDTSLVAAAHSIPPTPAGGIAVAADRRGWPVGWWVEALQEKPVFTGSNAQWLAFPDERTRASAVTELLASPNVAILNERAAVTDVRYLLLRKWDWIGWERWMGAPVPTPVIIYDDNETIVLEIAPINP